MPKPTAMGMFEAVGSYSAARLKPFASVPGLDTTFGLHSVRGRIDSYLRLLNLFLDVHAEDLPAMHRYLENGQWGELQHFAHSLKGTFATLGATRMQALAARLEADVRDQQSRSRITESMTAFESEWQIFVESLAAALAHATPANAPPLSRHPPPTTDAATVRATLDRIEALLAEDNMAVNAEYRGAAELLRACFGDELKQFEGRLQSFDYVAALQWLRQRRVAREP